MRVLAMASQKGGSGKTTLSGHLAVQAQLSGAGPACLIDIDPQGSLADWWNEREAEMPAFAQTTVARLASDLEVLRQQGFRLAVIDTPPAITMLPLDDAAKAGEVLRELRPADGFHRTGEMPSSVAGCDSDGLRAHVEPEQLAALRKRRSEFRERRRNQRCHVASLRSASRRIAAQKRA